jgi:hypothetical protein
MLFAFRAPAVTQARQMKKNALAREGDEQKGF